MAELDVNGLKVTVRDSLPAKSFYPVHKALRAWTDLNMGDRDPESEMAPYVGIVTAWPYTHPETGKPLDPSQLSDWLELDVLSDWPPLLRALNNYLIEKINATATNAKN